MTVHHVLLRRQLKRLFGEATPTSPEWQRFIETVDQTYQEAESDRRMLERSLDLSSQELLQANSQMRIDRERFFALSVDMLAVIGFDGFFKQLNPAWEKTLGWTLDELLQRPHVELVHPEDRAQTLEEVRRETKGDLTITFENRYRCKDGAYRWLQWNAIPIVGQQAIYATARDVTERRRLEDQLRQSQKMEAIGRLAGGIAHDFNNLLTVIAGYSDSLQMQSPRGTTQWDTLEEIKGAAGRAAGLTRQLLAFSRRQVLQPKVLSLNDVVEGMQQMLHRLIGEQIALVTLLAPSLGLVRADPSQLDQVIVNLAVNARDAMPAGGRLLIETANVTMNRPTRGTDPDVPEGTYVRLTVHDTGCGMDPETRVRIFEPFFTTKEAGTGTGLGLATVYGIVKQSGGHITVGSTLGQGSSFSIYLPRLSQTRAREPAAAPASDSAGASGGGETILLVEDEDAVRRLVRRVLEGRGYTVLEAGDCDEAVRQSEGHTGPIHLLLTDVVMPDGSGRAVAERLVPNRRDMKVLYMSGHTDSTILHHGIPGTDTFFLQKPFSMSALAHKVREVMDAPAVRGR